MLLRPGNAGANTAADHITVIDRSLAQVPADQLETMEILIAILQTPDDGWIPALDQDGTERTNGQVVELTDSVDLDTGLTGRG